MAFKSSPTFFSLARPCPNRLWDQVAPHWTLTFFISCPGAGRPRHQVLPTWTLKLFMFLLCSQLVGTCIVHRCHNVSGLSHFLSSCSVHVPSLLEPLFQLQRNQVGTRISISHADCGN